MPAKGVGLATARRTLALAPLWLLIMAILALGLPPQSPAAPYEPNDSLANPAGPLAIGQTYTAGLEAVGDRDFYFFYVTAPSSPTTLTLANLGGGTAVSYISARILDGSATDIGAVSYVNKGESGSATVKLEPQKYFVEVLANEGHGDSYSLVAGGSGGAFGSYSSIAARCASATTAVAKAKARLNRAESRLQRAVARLRRSRYAGNEAREQAKTGHLRAKAAVANRRNALKRARSALSPWCSIPR